MNGETVQAAEALLKCGGGEAGPTAQGRDGKRLVQMIFHVLADLRQQPGYIPIRQTDGAKYFWLNIRGDSMNAAGMNDGDQILVREQPEVENGEIAVVLVNGDEATVKTFRQEGNLVILTPRSSNPVHQPQVYDLKKTPVQVLGRVIECRKVY